MTGLLVVGASEHAKVVLDAAIACNRWEKFALVDDRWKELDAPNGIPLVGPCKPSTDLRVTYSDVVVAIGDAGSRIRLLSEFEGGGFGLPVIAHPSAIVSPTATIGEGSVLLAGSVVAAQATIGRGCIVNTNASVDHDCVLGDGVHVCPGVAIAGSVSIGDGAWIGIGAAVIQGVTIGSGAIVGAGAAVVEDVASNTTVAGVPARLLGS